jgi:uncharacterized protein
MNRNLAILFAIIAFFLIDLYAFQVVKTLTKSSSTDTRRLIYYFYWAIPLLSISVWAITQFLLPPDALSRVTRQFIWSAMLIPYFAKLAMVLIVLFDDVIRFFKWVFSFFTKPEEVLPNSTINTTLPAESISRSEFLMKTALTVGGTTAAGFVYGIVSGAHDYRIRRVTVSLKNLSKKFDGVKIGQLSDIHSGSFFNKTAVMGGVEMLMKEKPDVVFFTGDLVNNTADEVKNYIDIFNKVKAPLGVYSTLGNHDYGDYYQWPNAEAKRQNLKDLIKAHKLLGWDLLMDDNRFLTIENEKIAILGIQNWGGAGFSKYGDLNKAYSGAGVQDAPVKLLLSHDPSHWQIQTQKMTPDIDIAFAGHTHGMQFGVEIGGFQWSPVQWRYEQWAGLYQKDNQYLYVNRGFGYIGYPGRIGILPEITIMELRSV